MVVAAASPAPSPRRWRTPVSILALAALVATAVPIAADHAQSVSGNTIVFDHRGGNEWWVEVRISGSYSVHTVHALESDGDVKQLALNQWGNWVGSFHIEPGHLVRFTANARDGTPTATSCWFTHPTGAERCGSSTSATTTTGTGGLDAAFTSFRGNEYWVQANVGTNGPAIAKVEVRKFTPCGDTMCAGPFQPLAKQSWGPTAWAGSYHFPQGSILQMRATATNGATDLSSCRQWIPASNTDARIVPCPTGGNPQPTPFDATFTGVKGNHYWVQVNVAANEALKEVAFRVNCAPYWIPLAKQSWGGWAPTHQVIIPQGSKVDFKATSLDGDRDASGGYIWTAATPTTGCALGAWPAPGSKVVYDLSSGVCGGGECFDADATLALTYTPENHWQGVCTGETRHTATDGTVTRESFTSRNDIMPLFGKLPTSVGAQQHIPRVGVFYSAESCGIGADIAYTVDHRETRQSALVDGDHDPIWLDAWVADRDEPGENYEVVAFDTKLGLVFETQSYPRMSQQGSSSLYVTDTDAPLR